MLSNLLLQSLTMQESSYKMQSLYSVYNEQDTKVTNSKFQIAVHF